MSSTRPRPWVSFGGRKIGCAFGALLAAALSVQAGASASVPPGRTGASATIVPTVTVNGTIPYAPEPSETGVTSPAASCSRIYRVIDFGLYVSELAAFKADHAPDAADLLAHWMGGSGQSVNFASNSVLAVEAAEFPAFEAMNSEVQAYVREKLADGVSNISVPTNQGYSPAAQRPLVVMDFDNVVDFPALYWAFRATQGMKLTGTIRAEGSRYTGELTYVISDTYGFQANDASRLTGPFTRAMNYLQTNCGQPKYAGPHWFNDTLTVAAKFSAPASG